MSHFYPTKDLLSILTTMNGACELKLIREDGS